jgi:hypothetical protein
MGGYSRFADLGPERGETMDALLRRAYPSRTPEMCQQKHCRAMQNL